MVRTKASSGFALQAFAWQERFSAYGTQVEVRTNRASILPTLMRRLPLGSEPIEADTGFEPDLDFSIEFPAENDSRAILRFDGRRVGTCQDEAELLDFFERQVTWRVSLAAKSRVFIHAGVVAWRGQGILIPGQTCFGKTTLVMRFLEAGATYYSDDLALLDGEGLVHPYARALQVRRQSGSLLQTRVPVEEIGGAPKVGREPIRPALMLACRYRQGAHWRPTELTPGAAALELLRQSFSAHKSTEFAFHAAGHAASQMSSWRGTRGEAQPVVEWALKLLDAG
jgi:hypothetical protein